MESNKTLSLKKDELNDSDARELAELRAEKLAREEADAKLVELAANAATTIVMNLPPASGKGIHYAGLMYVHGKSYQVTNDVKWALEEAQNRCWSHEASLKESENKGRTKRRAYVG